MRQGDLCLCCEATAASASIRDFALASGAKKETEDASLPPEQGMGFWEQGLTCV